MTMAGPFLEMLETSLSKKPEFDLQNYGFAKLTPSVKIINWVSLGNRRTDSRKKRNQAFYVRCVLVKVR
jgi:hypothetical protein